MKTLSILLFLPILAWGQLTTAPLPDVLNESSALEWASPTTLWTINDSGNDPELFEIDLDGHILKTIDLRPWGVKNIDFETLAADALYLYIGDVGNNWNERKDLTIYRLSKAQLRRGWGTATEIHFTPAEQHEYPPSGPALQYDFEGMYASHHHLVLFSKNRTEPLNNYTRRYFIPKTPGDHTITCTDSIWLHGVSRFQNWVAGADQHSSSGPVALISGPMIHLLYPTARGTFQDVPVFIPSTQKEGILFQSPTQIILTDERNEYSEGNLYRGDLSDVMMSFNEVANAPVVLLNSSITRGEKAILRINYMFNIDLTANLRNDHGEIVATETLLAEYYPRDLGVKENLIQSKTIGFSAAGLSPGTYTIEVEHPLEQVHLTLTVRP